MIFKKNKLNIKSNLLKPGYNIESYFDLEQTRKYIHRSKNKTQTAVLPLTSMIDMFSMIVIFLILNFSTTGDAYFVARGVVLPEAKSADLMKTHPLISILADRVYLDAIPADSPKVELEDKTKPYPKLRKLLKQFIAKKLRDNPSVKPEMTVNIQADVNLPSSRVKEVMKLLIDEGWTGIQLTVKKNYN